MTALGQTGNDGVTRLRTVGAKGRTGQLTVPAFIAAEIPFGTRFRAEVTDDGILFRYLGAADPSSLIDKPAWMTAAAKS